MKHHRYIVGHVFGHERRRGFHSLKAAEAHIDRILHGTNTQKADCGC